MAIHEILTRKRVELGLSIDDVVQKSGIAKGTVSKIMSGNTPNPQIESLKAITYALNLTLDDLDETSKKPELPGISPAALELARIYDTLDTRGQELINTIARLEVGYTSETKLPKGIMPIGAMPMKMIPHIGTLDCTGSIETRHAARQELAEMLSAGQDELNAEPQTSEDPIHP